MQGFRRRWLVDVLVAAATFLVACGSSPPAPLPPPLINRPVSAHDLEVDALAAVQNEARMVRARRPNGATRLIASYNDDTTALEAVDGGAGWGFKPGKSIAGWATSDDGGMSWQRHDQLAASLVPLAVPGGGMATVDIMRGDPWLSARGSTVIYTNIGQHSDPFAWRWVMFSRSKDGGESFEPVRIVAEDSDLPDGPKSAITRDGGQALITWMGPSENAKTLPHYVLITDPSDVNGPMEISSPQTLDVHLAGDWPKGQGDCTVPWDLMTVEVKAHPAVAAGDANTFYVAAITQYGGTQNCVFDQVKRLEVYRNKQLSKNQPNGNWERILSVTLADSRNSLQVPYGRNNQSRGSARPSLALARTGGVDVVVVATEERQATALDCNEASRQKVVIRRIANAKNCFASTADKTSCNNIVELQGTEPENWMRNAQIDPMWRRQRAGGYAVQPGLFTGQSDGDDARIGLVWYRQPYRDRVFVPNNMVNNCDQLLEADFQKMWTVAEGAVSRDAGASWGMVTHLSIGTPLNYGVVGDYFVPCSVSENSENYLSHGIYGEYTGGAFRSDDPLDFGAHAAWTDSRQDCINHSTRLNTQHQHIFAGGVYF